MKILWQLPEVYWEGASGQCSYCGTRFELESQDKFEPIGFDYTEYADMYGVTRKAFFIRLEAVCPTCKKEAFVTREVK